MRSNFVTKHLRSNSVTRHLRSNSVTKHLRSNSVTSNLRSNSVTPHLRSNSVHACSACVLRVHASCVRRAFVVRASCVRERTTHARRVMRACVVRAFVRAPRACVGTYGNLWELMGTSCVGTCGNLRELCAWELMGTYGNLWELIGSSCVGSSCVGTYENSVRGCKAFLHCGFELCDVFFTLRCYDAKRFHNAVLLCVTF